MDCKEVTRVKAFQGQLIKVSHESAVLGCTMKFHVYLPPQAWTNSSSTSTAAAPATIPYVYFLSGLTCTEDNFVQKSGALRVLAELGLGLVAPDTSPRGVGIPGEDDSWDFGTGAGFYVDATEEPWSKHYRMYSYVTEELPRVVAQMFPMLDPARQSVMGHSMGGHGALMIYLRNPSRFRSVSAFAPIAHPSACPWGQKAFRGYLGGGAEKAGNLINREAAWKQYDATELLATFDAPHANMLIDQGTEDQFWKDGQLLPEHFLQAWQANPKHAQWNVEFHLREGYDHGYFFISTFIESHLRFHWKHLTQSQ